MTESTPQIRQQIYQFIDKYQTLELATVAEDGIPSASYAPFVRGDSLEFFVLLSDLATHTRNINFNNETSAMIIESELDADNIFARERLVLQCRVKIHDRTEQIFAHCISKFKVQFGPIADTLAQLMDFNLYSLHPYQGVYVKGFGQAYRIFDDKLDKIEHIGPSQLRRKKLN